MPAAEQGIAAQWQAWRPKQHLTGNAAVPDYANPEQMNRYTWYQAHDWKVPYPGDSKIYAPDAGAGRLHPELGLELTSLGTTTEQHATRRPAGTSGGPSPIAPDRLAEHAA